MEHIMPNDKQLTVDNLAEYLEIKIGEASTLFYDNDENVFNEERAKSIVSNMFLDINILVYEALNAKFNNVDRFEVIDESGRSYVKGSIYGTPISIEVSLQDDSRTLKVFVDDRK